MRCLLCLSLSLFLFLSSPLFVLATEVTDPTVAPAPDLSDSAIPAAVDANNAVAAALIGLGVQPGTSLDDFNQVVTDCVTALDDQGVFTDGKYAVIVNQEDGVTTMYAPVSLLDEVRTWLFDEADIFSDSYVSSITFSFNGSEYYCQVTDAGGTGSEVAYFCVVSYLDSYSRRAFAVCAQGPRQYKIRTSIDGGGFSTSISTAAGSGPGYSCSFSTVTGTDVPFSGLPLYTTGKLSGNGIYNFLSNLSIPDFLTDFDLTLGDLSEVGFYSWMENYSEFDGSVFVPLAVQSTYDQTIQTPQEYVQGGITDYTPPTPPDVTVPDWESPDVPQYPGSESAPPDNELLWGIRVAVSETIPYWIKTTAASIVEWLQRIYNHITDTVAGLVGVLSTQHDALLAKLDELKVGFGGESSAGDELQGDVDRQDQELDDMTDVMDSVTKPDIEEIDPDLTDEVDQEKLTEFTTPFVTMMTQGPFATMLVMSLTLVLCSYILYGKR